MRPSVDPGAVSEEEWAARCELAALYRLLAHFRMTDLIDTHLTARVPGTSGEFLINRYGVLFDHMTASDLVKIDLQGNVIDERGAADLLVNRAGFTIHSAIHATRPDAHWVIHTHTAAGSAVSAQSCGLLPISQHALKFNDCLAYHDYEGIALDLGERDRLVRDLGSCNAMILRNHGLLVVGSTAGDAFHEIWFLERACQIQIAALGGGREVLTPSVDIRRHTAEQYRTPESQAIVQLTWNAALTLLEGQQDAIRR
ncbi:class II aldolase/adducin family protein [Variovorax sp. J31P207]|uniref:class II aldolase/adducin family protein n=1 Tax=Variovorax sp. J31P207 TaxID=3053510 RepID=UPI002578F386|nr:class II aldolase/adducin family protein [Variovorax sp. J31P207]MDM0071583.1 class II aldolase/adducin family protein [Variovorax sp. J31P207]